MVYIGTSALINLGVNLAKVMLRETDNGSFLFVV